MSRRVTSPQAMDALEAIKVLVNQPGFCDNIALDKQLGILAAFIANPERTPQIIVQCPHNKTQE